MRDTDLRRFRVSRCVLPVKRVVRRPGGGTVVQVFDVDVRRGTPRRACRVIRDEQAVR